MSDSALFNFTWFNDLPLALKELSNITMDKEDEWHYKDTSTGGFPILYNYLHHTFAKLECEKKIGIEGDYAIFNTGLVTENQEIIFCYMQKNKKPSSSIPWYFIGWRKQSDRDLMKFHKLPDIANYFENPSELIYDTRLDLRISVDHIIQDNKSRFPAPLDKEDDYLLGNILQGTIDDAIRRIKRNYKTAIPQYYNGKIQLLLPLCLRSKAKADLALVVEKENRIYRASTCLTLDMAINNARLIAKPDDEWLKP